MSDIESSAEILLPGDFRPGFTNKDARAVLDEIACMAQDLVELVTENPRGLSGDKLQSAAVLARLIGLRADQTAGV